MRLSSAKCLAILAAVAVLLRLVLADEIYFRLLRIPGHDMSEGLAFFTTAIHSVYLTGDLAWWNPVGLSGYAQYFQAMVGPLTPTWGNIVFIAWAQVVGVLSTFGVHIPEYYQYLFINYVALAFLAFWAFAYFCSQFLRAWQAVAFALMTFVLSGIGLWESAWFFFQEPATFFFLVGSLLALLRHPSRARLCVFYVALLVQFASLNYWTVYNLPFFLIVMAAHAMAYGPRWRRAARWFTLRMRFRGLEVAATSATLLMLVCWTGLLAAVMWNQSGRQVRKVYTLEEAVDRTQEARRFTTELFNPLLRRGTDEYPIANPADLTKPPLVNSVHHARYIGMAVLPFALIPLLGRWTRRTRWMLVSALGTLAMALASPLAMGAWLAIPMMDRIQHVFYFYGHYWQIALVLLAAIGFDQVLSGKREREARIVVRLTFASASLLLLSLLAFSHEFSANDPNLQALVLTAVYLGIIGLFLSRWNAPHTYADRRLATVAILVFVLLDLSAYFYSVSRADMAFMLRRGFDGVVPTSAARTRLASAWAKPDPSRGFDAGIADNMPLRNDFWPRNTFMLPVDIHREDLGPVMDELRGMPAIAANGVPIIPDWKEWNYNGWTMEADSPQRGQLVLRQRFDPSWRFTVDGNRVTASPAGKTGTALPIDGGKHLLRAEFNPPARRIYPVLTALLEIVCAALLMLACQAPERRAVAKAQARRRVRSKI